MPIVSWMPALDGDLDLGADAVIGGDQDGIDEARGLQIEQAAEAADLGVGAGAARRAHERLDASRPWHCRRRCRRRRRHRSATGGACRSWRRDQARSPSGQPGYRLGARAQDEGDGAAFSGRLPAAIMTGCDETASRAGGAKPRSMEVSKSSRQSAQSDHPGAPAARAFGRIDDRLAALRGGLSDFSGGGHIGRRRRLYRQTLRPADRTRRLSRSPGRQGAAGLHLRHPGDRRASCRRRSPFSSSRAI